MYADHVPIIAAGMRNDPAIFMRGVMFAVLSARQPFGRIKETCTELEEKGQEAKCLFSWKLGSYLWMQEHYKKHWWNVIACNDPVDALVTVCQCPGLGVIKGAFVLQLMGWDVACLDTRNVSRENLPKRAWRSELLASKARPAFRRKCERYVAQTIGRAEELWNTWCNEVGPDYLMTGEECSKLHLTTIVPKSKRNLRMDVPIGSVPF